jgi:hypothetical protein
MNRAGTPTDTVVNPTEELTEPETSVENANESVPEAAAKSTELASESKSQALEALLAKSQKAQDIKIYVIPYFLKIYEKLFEELDALKKREKVEGSSSNAESVKPLDGITEQTQRESTAVNEENLAAAPPSETEKGQSNVFANNEVVTHNSSAKRQIADVAAVQESSLQQPPAPPLPAAEVDKFVDKERPTNHTYDTFSEGQIQGLTIEGLNDNDIRALDAKKLSVVQIKYLLEYIIAKAYPEKDAVVNFDETYTRFISLTVSQLNAILDRLKSESTPPIVDAKNKDQVRNSILFRIVEKKQEAYEKEKKSSNWAQTQMGMQPDVKKLTPEQILVALQHYKTRDSITPAEIQKLKSNDIQKLSAEDLNGLTDGQIKALSDTQIQSLNQEQLSGLNDTAIAALNLSKLSLEQINMITPQNSTKIKNALKEKRIELGFISQLNDNDVAGITPAQIAKLSTQSIGKMSPDQIHALSYKQVEALSDQQIQGITPSNLKKINTKFLTDKQLKLLSAAQINEFENPLT